MICPLGCQDGLDASPSPEVSISALPPSRVIRQICCGPERPDTNTISVPVLGLTLGSTSIFRVLEMRCKWPPSRSDSKMLVKPLAEEANRIFLPSGEKLGVAFSDTFWL